MTKNNLKIVKSGKNQESEVKEKNKALEAAISQIDENFGKGSVMKLGQKAAMNIEAISTGSLSLDLALGMNQECALRDDEQLCLIPLLLNHIHLLELL